MPTPRPDPTDRSTIEPTNRLTHPPNPNTPKPTNRTQLERPTRTKALKERLPSVKVPPAAYLPLCKSTDPWCRIMGLIPEEARAFSTKARCPCLVLVEVERDTVRCV